MSYARKCDRCGKFYIKNEFQIVHVNNSGMIAKETGIDLCVSCNEAFTMWLNLGKEMPVNTDA